MACELRGEDGPDARCMHERIPQPGLGLEDVAAHVQWSEAAGKSKLIADEVNDIRGMLQVRGLLPPPIYVTLCICVCTHSYTNINTVTQTRKAMMTLPLCVVISTH